MSCKRITIRAVCTLRQTICWMITIAAVGLFGGCTVGKDYAPPTPAVSDAWQSDKDLQTAQDPNMAEWWKVFNDAELDSLIQRAVAENLDIRAALHRLEVSRAMRDYTSGQYYPTVNATGSYARIQGGKDGGVQLPEEPDPYNFHSAGFDFLWEIDLFGRIKRSVESAEASYQASVEEYRATMVTLLSEVCRNYIDLRTTQARIACAENNIEIQQKTLELTQSRFQYEIAGELDVRQAQSNLATTQSEVPQLRVAEASAIHRIAVLLGQNPEQIKPQLTSTKPLPVVSRVIAAGLPADMLRQRPDIRAAERRLAAQTARIGVATADLYPSLQLTGTFEIQSRQLSGLGNIHNQTYSVGPGLRWNLFDGNRIRNTIKMEEAATKELLAVWENTVLTAVEDVENAMVAYSQQQQRKQLLTQAVDASIRAVELANQQYLIGLTDFQNVLNSQRTLFVQQDRLAASEGEHLQALVRIYKSFGGGWQLADNQSSVLTAAAGVGR